MVFGETDPRSGFGTETDLILEQGNQEKLGRGSRTKEGCGSFTSQRRHHWVRGVRWSTEHRVTSVTGEELQGSWW